MISKAAKIFSHAGRLFRKLALIAAVVCALPVSAETVSQKQASQIASTFFNAAYGIHVAAPKLVWNGRQLTTDRLFSPFYIYNHPKGGFVIVSAENKAFPILAYSRTGQFDRSRLGDMEKKFLDKYAHEIEIIRYDSRTPQRAIEAWQNLPAYINSVLTNPYGTPEYHAQTPERQEEIETVDRRNGWIIMPTAVEFDIYDPDYYRDLTLDDVTTEAEDVPFKFYEDFLREIEGEEAARAAALEEKIAPTRPMVSALGGAHFAISFPENIRMMRVYDMQGARKLEKYYKKSQAANVDLSSMPAGFYAVMFLAESGRIYGFKLYR